MGATGRACIVMYAGPEWLAENNITPVDYETADFQVTENGGWLDV